MRKTILLLGVLFATTAFAQEQLSDLIVRKYTVPIDKRITFESVGVTSPDKRRAGVVIFQMQFNTSNLQSAHMLSFDENGLKWEHPIDFDFENETLHFYQCGQYGEQNTVEDLVEFGHISSGKLLVTKDNRLALGGYYATAPDEKETGCYIATTQSSLSRIHLNLQEFPASYYAYQHSATKQSAKDFNAYTIDFLEFSDSSLVLLGEMQTLHRGIELQTTGGPILVHFADKTGEFNDFKTINKNQCIVGRSSSPTGLRSRMFSYYAMMYQDKIHLFFHDNCENYNGETDKHTFISERVFGVGLNYDDVCAAHCTINSKHDISRPEMLMNYQEHKCYMLEPLFITPDGLILCRSDKVSNRISKLTHPF